MSTSPALAEGTCLPLHSHRQHLTQKRLNPRNDAQHVCAGSSSGEETRLALTAQAPNRSLGETESQALPCTSSKRQSRGLNLDCPPRPRTQTPFSAHGAHGISFPESGRTARAIQGSSQPGERVEKMETGGEARTGRNAFFLLAISLPIWQMDAPCLLPENEATASPGSSHLSKFPALPCLSTLSA